MCIICFAMYSLYTQWGVNRDIT